MKEPGGCGADWPSAVQTAVPWLSRRGPGLQIIFARQKAVLVDDDRQALGDVPQRRGGTKITARVDLRA